MDRFQHFGGRRLRRVDKSGSRINSVAINARNSWWSFISSDAGLLHATLATWALYGMLVRGMDDLQSEKIRHKSEAIKEVNNKINSLGGHISDELVGTVATLASCEVRWSDFPLLKMVRHLAPV